MFAKNFARNHEKKYDLENQTLLMVDDSFVPSSKQPRILYCKLTDFRWLCEKERLSAILSIYELFVIYLSELIFFV